MCTEEEIIDVKHLLKLYVCSSDSSEHHFIDEQQ